MAFVSLAPRAGSALPSCKQQCHSYCLVLVRSLWWALFFLKPVRRLNPFGFLINIGLIGVGCFVSSHERKIYLLLILSQKSQWHCSWLLLPCNLCAAGGAWLESKSIPVKEVGCSMPENVVSSALHCRLVLNCYKLVTSTAKWFLLLFFFSPHPSLCCGAWKWRWWHGHTSACSNLLLKRHGGVFMQWAK